MIEAYEVARSIAERHRLCGPLRQLDDGGINHVFAIESATRPLIIRFAVGAARAHEFESEAWCLTAAQEAGIPSPKPVAFGMMGNVPYGIQTFIAGSSGTHAYSCDVWHQLGRFAQRVARIPLTGATPASLYTRFGRNPEIAWDNHIRYNVDALGVGDDLQRLGVYPAGLADALRQTFLSLKPLAASAGLTHGDLAPRNLIHGDEGYVLIDWGAASIAPAPWSDLEVVYSWSLADPAVKAQDVEAFADGCGIGLATNRDTVIALCVLHHIDLVRWSMENDPGLLDHYADRASAVIDAWRSSGGGKST